MQYVFSILLFVALPLAFCQFITPRRTYQEVNDLPFTELDETEYAISE